MHGRGEGGICTWPYGRQKVRGGLVEWESSPCGVRDTRLFGFLRRPPVGVCHTSMQAFALSVHWLWVWLASVHECTMRAWLTGGVTEHG